MPHISSATQIVIENIAEIDFTDASAPCRNGGQPPKNNVQTNTLERSSGGEATRFILPSYPPSTSGPIPKPERIQCPRINTANAPLPKRAILP
jgi:hypothetical protein